MSYTTFDADSISALAYDFTGLRRKDGEGYCTGKGTIPEPTAFQLKQFDDATRAVDGFLPSPHSPPGRDEAVVRANIMGAIVDLAGEDGPTHEQLDELEPRTLRSFFAWLRHELKSATGGGVAGW
jgi:hypothetical protein